MLENISKRKNSWWSLFIKLVVVLALIALIALVLRLVENYIERPVKAYSYQYLARVINLKPERNIKLKAGEIVTIKIRYKNLGYKDWVNSGSRALYLKAKDSNFYNRTWLGKTTPIRLFYPKIRRGDAIWFIFKIKAPAINGLYKEKFFLKAGNYVVKNSTVQFNITVYGGKNPVKKVLSKPVQQNLFTIHLGEKNKLPLTIESKKLDNYQILLKNGKKLSKIKGKKIKVDFNFDLKRYFILDQNNRRLLMTDEALIFSPQNGDVRFEIGNNEKKYRFCGKLEFEFKNNTLHIINTSSAKCLPEQEQKIRFWQVISPKIEIKKNILFKKEPNIRVGLFYITKSSIYKYLPIKIKTLNNQPYNIKTKNGTLLTRATKGDLFEISYSFKYNRYFIRYKGKRLAMTDEPIRFIPDSKNAIFKIVSWKNGPFWGMNVNDNEFRGILEIQYNPSTSRLWIINELPIEKYLRGVSEVWDSWPYEFLKAQKVAARTYALFRLSNPKYTKTPNKKPIFTVRATQADQVYRGYLGELRNSCIVRAVKETRGLVITYQGKPIAAYYFAQSDGRTRDSYRVRMTSKPVPYLISRPDPPGEGHRLKGHGVGLPQQGGKVAAEQGANYFQILKYYYPGTEITKMY
ncbi:SpoIID/LytB domain-containing protein [bacterium]|nr:SpoIID/LytB domain-containing protein [bacterium]